MADLYERFPNKSWYIWADDDTYLYPKAILEFLEKQDQNEFLVFGVIYCAWDSVAAIIEPVRQCHPFAQGGAGVFISHKMMSSIAPYLRNCSEMFNDPNFAGSMRFAICIERNIGTDIWNIGDAAKPMHPRLHSGNPLAETEDRSQHPLSFHRMRHVLLYQIWNATESIWTDGDGKEKHCEWDNITMSPFEITIGNERKPMKYHWGFRVRYTYSKDRYIYAITRPEPVFRNGDTKKVEPIMFDQKFEGNFTLRYICDDRMLNDEMLFDSYLYPEEGTAYRVKCQPSSTFFNNGKIKKPKIIPMDKGMLEF